ncbi:MAG: hypothetical protein KDM63_03345 [Verrucomicrobiae bacterium]|nr:hypothetical protein [Verrucomicrobiae bacterium]
MSETQEATPAVRRNDRNEAAGQGIMAAKIATKGIACQLVHGDGIEPPTNWV